jgi:regulator of protease activity HflC (stomatin/prohibitin superfamily)
MNSIKDFLDYLLNAFKIWVIVQPWEQALRVRCGKNIRLVHGGIYFKIPYIDSFYIQQVRLRVISLPMQTVTSKDGKTITLAGSIGYQITDIKKMYTNLYHPELTLSNIVMNELAQYIYTNDLLDIKVDEIEVKMTAKMQGLDYGISVESFKLLNFSIVKTFRLIQDHSWVPEGMALDVKS